MENVQRSIQQESLRVIYSLISFLAAIFFILSAIGKAGPAGNEAHIVLNLLLGVVGYFLLPLFLCFLGIVFLTSIKQRYIGWVRILALFFGLISLLAIISTLYTGDGGFIGNIVANPLLRLFDEPVTLILLFGILLVSIIVSVDTHLNWQRIAFWKKDEETDDGKGVYKDEMEPVSIRQENMVFAETAKTAGASSLDSEQKEKAPVEKTISIEKPKKTSGDGDFMVTSRKFLGNTFTPPPLDLLEEDRGKPGVGDIKANANIIKRTLQNFGINVEMDEISIGPSVTRYALKPAEGVKLSRIVGLQNDLALALAAHPIRIEAPIPGKSLVGIEIPNSTKTTVGLGTLFANEEFQTSEKPLLVALGRGISGKIYFANLAKMPHLLIAGATGSGKSVTIHALLTSLLYRNSPENLKFIMIDPKRVELTLYNNIPHLLTPVITEPKKAILALKWTAKEMDRRYDILEAEKVRDIESYHKNIVGPALKKIVDTKKTTTDTDDVQMPETMPYIVVIIDELADLMQAYPRELEASVVRLAQMSRAVGIHLVLSTQRPSVNVITGLIKANIPSRIALQVTSQIDSRTILDTGGAEKLLGAGDMLYMSGEMSKPQRIQSAFISERELKNVVGYFVETYADALPSDINLTEAQTDKNSLFESSFGDDEEDDELYEEARDAVIKAGKASTSYLQRKLRIGYARAARLIDILEERGVIGPGEGAKPREVIDSGNPESPTNSGAAGEPEHTQHDTP